jgi:hypothetical protein
LKHLENHLNDSVENNRIMLVKFLKR